MNQDGPLINL